MKLRTTLLATGAIVATGIVAHQIRKRRAFARWANDPVVNDTLGVGAVMGGRDDEHGHRGRGSEPDDPDLG